MKILVVIGIAVLALSLFSCKHVNNFGENQVYAAWEDGLTLIFENISLSNPNNRNKERQLVRVEKSSETSAGLVVVQDVVPSHRNERVIVVNKDGRVVLRTGSFGNDIVLLPGGFPNTITEWKSGMSFSRIIGRANFSLPVISLFDGLSNIGVWVETVHLDQANNRTRTLYLPNIGEVETMCWDQDKHCWVTSRRLIHMGFTDTSVSSIELLKVS